MLTFQRKFDNGYDLYSDPLYLNWLRHEHPDSLPEHLNLDQHANEQPDPIADELDQEVATNPIHTSVGSRPSLEGSSTSLSSSLS